MDEIDVDDETDETDETDDEDVNFETNEMISIAWENL
jgi:hypothetical protein